MSISSWGGSRPERGWTRRSCMRPSPLGAPNGRRWKG
jgi:hypothetical protein